MESTARQARDEWIARRCQLGEPEAFADLVRELERPLLYFAQKLLGNEDSALDVLQEVWLNAFQTIRRLDNPRVLRPWLYRMTRGLAIDRIRKDQSDERLQRVYAEQAASAAEEPAFDEEDAAAVHQALDTLDVKHREVLVLCFLEDMTIAEIASIVGCPEGTVKSRIHHAKRALKAALQGTSHERRA
ncbi:MAG: sigma-70 family RNA polymerase sigma factor [Planctomycetes bacterium]|nr:sigma-70 family RNA polymerase sigma factor [Planctomycetota bacterium]